MPYRHQSPDSLHCLLRQALEPQSARKDARRALLAPHSALRHKLPERFAYFYQRLRRLPRKVRRYWRLKLGASLAGAALALTLSSTPVAHAAEISVTTNATAVVADDGLCSLIEAIINANNDAETYADCAAGSGADTITLADDVYILSQSDDGINGLPLITSTITIQGNGATITSNSEGYRILRTAHTGALSIYDTTISGALTARIGAGILNSGVMTITNSTISDNFQEGSNGGGGIYNEGDMTLVNSTVSGNTALVWHGGGIYNDGDLTLVNSTISGNKADGYYGAGIASPGVLTITNSIIADNKGDTQCYLGWDTEGTIHASYSLIEGGLGCVNGTNTNNLTDDPKLGPLQDNGGSTFTHALFDGSPAIDAGSNAAALDAEGQPLTTDQRGIGFPRIANDTVDLGAFEAYAGCLPFPRSVANSTGLNEAITCFNSETDAGEYQINLSGDIALDASTVAIANTNPEISLRIDGNGYSVDGQNLNGVRPFTIQAGASVTMQAITVTHGLDLAGAGIHNSGTLTLNYSLVSDNNSVLENGGGIYNNGGTVTLNNSIIYQNQSAEGGGIYNSSGGTVSLVNSTISSNAATDQSGGIASHGVLTLINSTVADNNAPEAGGIRTQDGTTTLVNTLIANNLGGDCGLAGSSTMNASYSLIEGGLGCVNGTNANNLTGDPNLGPLQNNGGPTLTYALLDGSPAMDAGSDAGALDTAGQPLTTDQRGAGFPRSLGNAVDIGAYEKFSCVAFPIPVGSSSDLDIAIRCFNAQTAAGEYGITLTDDIALDGSPTAINNPDPAISLRVAGNGHTVDGQNLEGVRPFTVNADTIVAMEAITLTRGNVTSNSDGGGGILNYGNLTLANSKIMNNTAGIHRGGGIHNVNGVVTLIDTTVDGNDSRNGGGIRNHEGEMTLINTTVSNNTAERLGGGIYNETLAGGMMRVINSTISGNKATQQSGGGIINNGILIVTNSTIANNNAAGSGGLRTHDGTTTLVNTLIADNHDDCDITAGGTLHASYSLIEDGIGLGCINGTSTNNLAGDPKLGPLQDNGGRTFTHALLGGSSAMDAGSDAGALDAEGQPLTTDQRGTGFPRSLGSAVDIGAYEYSDTIAPTAAPTQVPAANGNGWNSTPITVTWNWADNAGGSGIDATNCTSTSGSGGEGEIQLTAMCTDLAGNQGSADYTIKVDQTAPTATLSHESSASVNGWYTSPVTLTWEWADNLSGIDPLNCTTTTISSNEGESEVSATCADLAGNVGETRSIVRIDTMAPAASPVQTPITDATSSEVVIVWNWTDGAQGSGIDTANCTTTSTAGDEAAVTLTATCADLAGNVGNAMYSVNVGADTISPTANPTQAPAANGNGWNSTPVTITWNWADNAGGSGIDAANCTAISTSGDEGEVEFTATCADVTGNVGNASYPLKIDRTAPAISAAATSAPNAAGWYTGSVTVQFTCTDTLSGIVEGSCPSPQALEEDGEMVVSTALTVTDVAGNISEPSNVVTVQIDKTPPSLDPVVSPNEIVVGSPATVIAGATDLLSGIANQSCDALDTSAAGVKTITCVAEDHAGNTASVTVEVLVKLADGTNPPQTDSTYYLFLPEIIQ